MNWVTIIILFLILKKFFFEKVNNFLAARQNAIKETYDTADAVNRKADEKLEAYNKRIANIESEGREIVKNAKLKADSRANEIIDEVFAILGGNPANRVIKGFTVNTTPTLDIPTGKIDLRIVVRAGSPGKTLVEVTRHYNLYTTDTVSDDVLSGA
jgi:hypothetical protein